MRPVAVLAAVVVLLLCGCAPAPAVSPAVARVSLPPLHGRFDYQIGGPSTPAAGVRIVDRDRTAPSAKGVYGICYVNAFQTQPDASRFWARHADLVLHDARGRLVADPDWPGEHALDIRTAAKRAALLAIEGPWLDGCARAGYRAVEPDNLDTFTRFGRDGLTADDALAMAALLAARAHRDGLAIAQKNTDDLGDRGRTVAHLDFAVAEECQVYAECDRYTSVYGDHVIEIEYTDNGRRAFRAACAARGSRISVELRDRDVVPPGARGHVAAWC